MNFSESFTYLLSLGNEVSAMKLGLENIRKLLSALGNPQRNFKKVQVAGTNGKGSTCAFLDSICREAGIKTGLYTSPHLVSITERIKIDGIDISEEDFARHAIEIREIAETKFDVPPTFFEQVTAIALAAFAEAGIELAILETGLGGRLDATTAANAEIAVITPIDYDHQQYLGDTIEMIAAEKVAIIRENSKVIISPQIPAAEKVVLDRCERFGIIPVRSGEIAPDINLGLLGAHQRVNAATAQATARVLNTTGFEISEQHILVGLSKATHPGRSEYVDGILLDGAHNPAGAHALAQFLDESVKRPLMLIFGAMGDKDIAQITEILFPKATYLVLTQIDNSRSAAPGDLRKLVPATFPKDNVFSAQNAAEALEIAQKLSEKNVQICVTGSLYLVGEIRNILKESI